MGMGNVDEYKIIMDFFDVIFSRRQFDENVFKRMLERVVELHKENEELRKRVKD